jgi:hypothetical protein
MIAVAISKPDKFYSQIIPRPRANMDDLITTIKTFETADMANFTKELVSSLEVSELFKLIKAATNEAEKKSKTAGKVAGDTATTRKKSGSMPKGAVPPQLKKPRAWVEFTLKHALENGWEAFTVLQKKKDNETNTITEEQIEMPGSILHNGAYIYEDSVNEKTPEGRQIIHKEAMSLSKQRKESGHATYAEFEAQYVDEIDDDKSVSSSTSSQRIVVKKTAAEKEAEAAAKKAEKEAEKAAAKAAKESAKQEKAAAKEAEKVAAKEAEKVAAKEAKEAEAAAKKAEKETAKKPIVKKAAVAAEPVTPIKKKETVASSAPKKKSSAKADE